MELAFARRVWVGAWVVVAVVATCVVVVYAASVLATLFVGVLFGVGLRGLGDALAARTPLGARWSMVLLLAACLGAALAFGFGVAPALSQQASEMSEQLPERVEQAEQWLRQSPVGGAMPERSDRGRDLGGGGVAGRLLSRATSSSGFLAGLTQVASTAFTAVASVLLVAAVALYLAFRPRPIVRGFLGLLPLTARPRTEQLLGEMAHDLRWWLLGQVSAMIVIGTFTWLGLQLAGVPMAVALAVLAALLNFIPNFGPVISVVPALLFANGSVPAVLAVYGVSQLLESYVITPNIQRVAVEMEPVVLIAAQVLMGALFGVAGLLVAAPVLVIVQVLVRHLWREDALHDPAASDPAAQNGSSPAVSSATNARTAGESSSARAGNPAQRTAWRR